MTPFSFIKKALIEAAIGSTIVRKELLDKARKEIPDFSTATFDSIRNYFAQAGYIGYVVDKKGARVLGKYILRKRPDAKLTKSQLLKEAYPYYDPPRFTKDRFPEEQERYHEE